MVKIASCSYHYAITSRLDLLLRSLIRSGSSLSYTVGHVWTPYLPKSTVDKQSQNLCKITWYDVWWNWILLNQRQNIPLILVVHVIGFVIRLGDFRNRATTTLLVAWASAASLPCMATTTGPDAMTSAENYHMESKIHVISKFGILNFLSRASLQDINVFPLTALKLAPFCIFFSPQNRVSTRGTTLGGGESLMWNATSHIDT